MRWDTIHSDTRADALQAESVDAEAVLADLLDHAIELIEK